MPITPDELDTIKRAVAAYIVPARRETPDGFELGLLEAIDLAAAPLLTEPADRWTGRRVRVLGGTARGYVVRTHRDDADADPHTLAVRLDGGGELLLSPRAAEVIDA